MSDVTVQNVIHTVTVSSGGPPNTAASSHVRKTITFDGTADKGALGVNNLFIITGSIRIVELYSLVTDDLVSADSANDTLGIGSEAAPYQFVNSTISDIMDTTAPIFMVPVNLGAGVLQGASYGDLGYSLIGAQPALVSSNIVMDIDGHAITAGEVVVDLYYFPGPLGGLVVEA